jgi:FAD dependent oxidoreductase
VRTEPTLMSLGQAAGTAAAFTALGGTSVQQVDFGRVQRALAEDGPLLPV